MPDLNFVIVRKRVTVCRSSTHTYTSLKYIHTNIITLRFDWYTKLSQASVIILKLFAWKRLYVVHTVAALDCLWPFRKYSWAVFYIYKLLILKIHFLEILEKCVPQSSNAVTSVLYSSVSVYLRFQCKHYGACFWTCSREIMLGHLRIFKALYDNLNIQVNAFSAPCFGPWPF